MAEQEPPEPSLREREDLSVEQKKILYTATVVKTHIMQFHIPYLHMLQDMGWRTEVAARNDY